jgi:molybdopterin molybdotransferase
MELSVSAARDCVLRELGAALSRPAAERVPLADCTGRWLAESVLADRDYPPFARSMRDGYAVRASDLIAGGSLRRVGEVRAGQSSSVVHAPGTCVEIMTGAALPDGFDSVVMVEHARAEPGGEIVHFARGVATGENVVQPGSEARAGQVVALAGCRLDFAGIAVLASVGCVRPSVARRPRVAILSTGDELAPASEPAPPRERIRDSNSWSLQAQVRRAGGEPVVMAYAPDRPEVLAAAVEQALACDLAVFSGGVSAGKYDFIEPVLARRGARFFFDAVSIRPGRPVVFGRADRPADAAAPSDPNSGTQSKRSGDVFFFGLPGNPLATFITFELFVRPVIALLSGSSAEALACPWLKAQMGFTFSARPLPLTQFLPVRLSGDLAPARILRLNYHGSADLVAAAASNAWLVVPEGATELKEGELVDVLPR